MKLWIKIKLIEPIAIEIRNFLSYKIVSQQNSRKTNNCEIFGTKATGFIQNRLSAYLST